MTKPALTGWFTLTSRDADGNIIGVREFRNGPTFEGVNYLLESGFRAGTRLSPWYVGLINYAGFGTVDSGDTHASHAGWSEYAGVSGGNRVAWTPGAAVGGLAQSGTLTTLTITTSGSVIGAFLDSRQPTGTGGVATMYCTGVALTPLAVVIGGTVTVGYSVRLAPG